MRPLRQFLRDLGLWTLYFPLRWTVLALPTRTARALGGLTGRLHARFVLARGGSKLESTMATLLGPEKARDAVRGYLVRKHQTLLEHFLIASRGERTVEGLLGEIKGHERLDEALEDEGGAVVALFHFGNIRMLAALGHRGYPLVQLLNRTAAHAGRGHSRFLADLVRKLKIEMDAAMPARFLHWRPGIAAREVYRVPTGGELLLVHLDGSRGTSFVPCDFLGGRAPFAAGPARIAHRMKVPFIPVFCLARPDGRHDLLIEPPIDHAGGPEAMTRACVRLLERYVREHPEQWWTWARLELEVDAEGRIQMEPRPAPAQEDRKARLAGAVS